MIDFQEIKKILLEGGVILYPTDSIWGLGCDARNASAVQKIYDIKQRSEEKSLVTLVKNEVVVEQMAPDAPETAYELWETAEKPLTIVLDGVKGLAPNAVAADGSAALRIPDHPFLNQLFQRFRFPIISTSANLSGKPSPVTFADIDPAIVAQVDWVCPDLPEYKGKGQASSILKLANNGEIHIIRK